MVRSPFFRARKCAKCDTHPKCIPDESFENAIVGWATANSSQFSPLDSEYTLEQTAKHEEFKVK